MNSRIILSIVVGIALIAAGLFLNWGLAKFRKEPARSEALAHQTLVEVSQLEQSDETLQIKGYGTLLPRIEANIPAEVGGKITYRNPKMEVGASVNKGEVLFRIDTANYKLNQEKARAAIQQTHAQLKQLRAEIQGQSESLAVAKTTLNLSKREFERFKNLVKKKATSRSVVDQKQNAYQNALANKVRIKNILIQAQARVGTIEATLRLQTAMLAEADLNLTRTIVSAPFSGRIESRLIEEGEYVKGGQVLGRMYDERSLEVHIPVALADLSWLLPDFLKPGYVFTPVKATIIPLSESHSADQITWPGEVSRVGAAVEPKARTLEFVITPSSAESEAMRASPLFLKGLFVQVNLAAKPLSGLFKVPRASISHRNRASIFAHGKLERRDVSVLRIVDDFAFIRGDISAGEKLILTPLPAGVIGMELTIATSAEPIQD